MNRIKIQFETIERFIKEVHEIAKSLRYNQVADFYVNGFYMCTIYGLAREEVNENKWEQQLKN